MARSGSIIAMIALVHSEKALQLDQSKKFASLEGLRGILCLSVLLGHYGLDKALGKIDLPFEFSYAVDIFFIISGFVLAHSNYYSQHRPTAQEFFVKRMARLYPLHIFSLMAVVLIFFITGRAIPSVILMQNILLLQNVGLPPNIYNFNFPNWSISVEFWCSIAFYFLTRLLPPKVFVGLALICLLSVSLFLPCVLTAYPPANIGILFNTGLIRGIIGFSIGVIIYQALTVEYLAAFLGSKFVVYIGIVIVAGLYFYKFNPSFAIVFYIASAIVVGGLARQNDLLRFLTYGPMAWLGKLSFSIYLLHIPMVFLFQMLLGDQSVKGSGKVLLIASVFMSSWISYRYLELPAQSSLRKLFLRRHIGMEIR
jgi:peptidoglycan/LPS O-acetylase OafA/YrhL